MFFFATRFYWIYGLFGLACAVSASLPMTLAFAQQNAEAVSSEGLAEADQPDRAGYLVTVELPLVGQRDELVRNQILRIADAGTAGEQRPIVVLEFKSTPLGEFGDENNGGLGSRGSQFERALALARFLTSVEASRVRLVAYLPESVEGHAVLPVLACEEIVAASDAELGRAAIDEAVDATVEGAYRDIVARRATLPDPIVMAMLDASAEVYVLDLSDGTTLVADRELSLEKREAGQVTREETIWSGGSLAQFSGQQLRNRRWIARTVNDAGELSEALDLSGGLRTVQQLPREWRPVKISISGELSTGRVNQLIRALDEAITSEDVNLVVLEIAETETRFSHASRLARFFADLDSEKVYTLALVTESVTGPAGLIAVACNETVLIGNATLGPTPSGEVKTSIGDTQRIVLGDLAEATDRPLPLLSAIADSSVIVNEYVHQQSGKRTVFAEWQIENQADANMWLAKQRIAGGEPIDSSIALRYRLVDSIDESGGLALSRLGIDQSLPELNTPWLDAAIQTLLQQTWLPRLLLTLGFFALMAELGSPGLSAGALIAGVCFVGFFWIEGLNGNVEWLEVLLFVCGLIALAVELFVLPGFGLFGIGGLLMLLVSVVLASQTFVWPSTSAELSEVASNMFWVSCLALCGMVGLLFMHKQLENSPILRWVTLRPTSSENEEISFRESVVHREHLLGQDGLTVTRLNPSGKAQFGRDIVAVVGTGGLIEEGIAVRVVEVRGNLVLVEEL